MASIDKFNDHCWKDVIPEADLKLYSGWRRETFVGPRPALLAIDLYDLVYRGGAAPAVRAQRALSQHLRHLRASRHRADQAALGGRPARRHPDLLLHAGNASQQPAARRGIDAAAGSTFHPTATRIYHEFTPEPSDVVIWKQRASIFQGTPLFSHLSLLGVQSLIVCGESTSGCVRASVVDGYSNGFHVSLVEECTYDRAELTHKVNLFDLHHKYADVMHVDEVVAHLDAMRMDRAAE